MKKILLATTMLAASAGFAAAEMAVTGSAVMGLGYSDAAAAGTDKTTLVFENYITFSGTGTTDGGLEFGATSTLGQYSALAPDYVDDGTTLFISGAFGKLTFGDVAEADEVAALSDIGLVGLGVDNIAEARSGDSNGGLAHNVNYTYATGPLSFSASALLGASVDAAHPNDSMAVGVKYSFGNAYVGLGYNDTNALTAADARDGKATSVYAGGTFGAVAVAAMYTDFASEIAANDAKAYGLTAAYTMDALTLTAIFADNNIAGNTKASYGLGASYDLGGGASVVGGVASVNGSTGANFGVSMTF